MVSYRTMTEAQRREYAAKCKRESNAKAEAWKAKHPVRPSISNCVKDATCITLT